MPIYSPNNNPKDVTYSIRVNRQQLASELRAMTDPLVQIWFNPSDLTSITLRDSYITKELRTRN